MKEYESKIKWWASRDLNPGPRDYESPALTTELEALETKMAEGEGFEPPEACTSTVFKTASLNHSDTPPQK